MPLSEHVFCVAITFKMPEQVEQQICIKSCGKLECSSTETLQMIQKAFRDDAVSAAQMKVWHKCFKGVSSLLKVTHVLEELQQAEHLRMLNSAQPQPCSGALWLLAFPKTQITFEREEISDHRWDSGKYAGAADGNSNKGLCRVFWAVEEALQNCVRSQGAYFEGDWGIIVLCSMFLVSCSINVSIFHSMWLDTSWTDLLLPKRSLFHLFIFFCLLHLEQILLLWCVYVLWPCLWPGSN